LPLIYLFIHLKISLGAPKFLVSYFVNQFMDINTDITRSNIKVYSIDGNQINFIKINNSIDISKSDKGVYLISVDGLVLKYIYQ